MGTTSRGRRTAVKELFPDVPTGRKDLGDLLVVLRVPGASHFVGFDSAEQKALFLSEVGKTIALQRIRDLPRIAFEIGRPNEIWLKVVSCAELKEPCQSEVSKTTLAPDDLLLGVEDFGGAHRGFYADVELKPRKPQDCR